MSYRRRSKRRTWIMPALIALVIFALGPFMGVFSKSIETLIEPYKGWSWIAAVLVAGLTVFRVWYEARRKGEEEEVDVVGTLGAYHSHSQRYLQRVVEATQYLTLASVDFQSADASADKQQRMRLPDVYIKLNTTGSVEIEPEKGKKKGEAPFGREETRPLAALEALVRDKRIVLLGDPGGGKTTFINHLAFCLASDALDSRAKWVQHLDAWPKAWDKLLPVQVTLRELAAWLAVNNRKERKTGLLEAYLQAWLANLGLADFYDTLRGLLQQGGALLLLDGLDEVPGDDAICRHIRGMLEDLPIAYTSPMVVTCRVLSYQDPRWKLDASKWPSHELAKLNEEQVDGFITAWYNQLKSMNVVADAAVRSGKLQRAVGQSDLWRLARNPLLLTVMALVHTRKGELPDARALLYEDAVELLLWRWEAGKSQSEEGGDVTWRILLQQAGLEDVDVQLALWELAYNAHAQVGDADDDEATADIAQTALESELRKLAPDGSQTWVDAMMQLMNLRAGLLIEKSPRTDDRPAIYGFPHRTFQEYLAGCYLSGQEDFIERTEELAGQGAFWWVVILLAVGRLVHVNKNIDKPLMLVHELCPQKMPDFADAMAWRKIWLAGACLREIGLKRSQRRDLGQELLPRLQTHLTTLITRGRLEPRERAEAGSVLSALGDDRDFAEMLAVPAGPFTMGSGEDDPDAFADEKPQHTPHVAAFRIGKYPVTNTQYAHFVAATGRPSPPHWRGQEPPPELRNHPVVNVTWGDAMAYCQWLSQQTGQEHRLPTEAEWEKAARGDQDARPYPWEGGFDPRKCNIDETGIGGTSPVGIFPAGASPYGCLDMSGNVWEWTMTKWTDDYANYRPDNRPDGDEPRVLRGGSFPVNRRGVRCAYRSGVSPDYGNHGGGFRVVAPGL